jgi:hypothetical protein
MATDWAVTTATERIKLDSHRNASTTFTVSNPGPRADRVVFDVLPGDGTAEDWFTVDQPQRSVPGNDSVSFVVETAVPVGVADGTYSYQALVYSVDVPPEENSRLSGRITFDVVNPKPVPKPPWKLIAIAAAAVVALGITLWLVFSGGSVTTPDVQNKSEADAVLTLENVGLKAVVRHKQDPAHLNLIVGQDPVAGTEVDEGSTVAIHLAVSLTPPVLTAPANGAAFDDRRVPALRWQAVAGASTYKVTVSSQNCTFSTCGKAVVQTFTAKSTTLTPKVPDNGNGNTIVTWSVQAVDDLGTGGPPSGQFQFRLGPPIIG